MNLHASFWKYDGNHHNGKDSIVYDPHNFGVNLVRYAAFVSDNTGWCQLPNDILELIKVHHRKGDSFGHRVTVNAPKEVWELVRKNQIESGYLFGYSTTNSTTED